MGFILLIKAIAGNNSVIDAMKVVSWNPLDGLNPILLLAPDGKRNSVDSWLFDIEPTNILFTLNPAFDNCSFKSVWVSNLLSDVTMYITVFAFPDFIFTSFTSGLDSRPSRRLITSSSYSSSTKDLNTP